jgi:hypothetical protein
MPLALGVDTPEEHLDHAPFAALLPSERKAILERATARLPWANPRLVTFVTSQTKRTYVTVCLTLHRGGVDEYVTWLVAFGDKVHFDNGHYGFMDEESATRDMYNRAL